MSNLITKTTELAMAVTLSYISKGDMVIDATCGTGQDTTVLANAVGKEGHVYAFDIQRKALLLTEARLRSHGHDNVTLLQKSFASMSEHIPDNSAAAKKRILEWAESLDSGKYHVAFVSLLNQKNYPPEILWITKKQ